MEKRKDEFDKVSNKIERLTGHFTRSDLLTQLKITQYYTRKVKSNTEGIQTTMYTNTTSLS